MIKRYLGKHEEITLESLGPQAVRSRVRSQLLGVHEPIYRGYTVWRGLARLAGVVLAVLPVFFCAIAPAFGQTTLNVSQDLVRLGIASSNMLPNQPSQDSAPLLSLAIAYALANRISQIVANQGAYYLLNPQTSYAYVSIVGTSNLTIDFQGSDLYVAKPYGWSAFFAAGNNGLVMQNFTVDYIQPEFTQLKVVSVNAAQGQFQYTVQPGYVDPGVFLPATLSAFIFRDGQVFSGLNGLGRLSEVAPIGGNQIQVVPGHADTQYLTPAVIQQIRPGDIAVVYVAAATSLLVLNCTSCTLQNIRSYAGTVIFNAESSLIERVYVMPRPGTDRLISSGGDGIDLRNSGVSNTMRFCRSIRTLDDGIAVWEWPFGQIQSVTGARTAVVEASQWGSLTVLDAFLSSTGLSRSSQDLNLTPAPGSTMVFDSPADRVVLGSAVVTSATAPAHGADGLLQMVLTFDRDLPPNVTGTIVYAADPHYRAGNSLIERNTVQYRGSMGTQMTNSTVQGNYIRKATGNGMYNNYSWQDSYPPTSNMTLSNNVIDGTNSTRDVYSADELAGIELLAFASNLLPTVGVLQNIAITGNFIADPGNSAVWMGNVAGGSVTGNYFLNPNDSYVPPMNFCCNPADLRLPVAVENSTNLTISNNTIDQTSGRMIVTDTQYNDLAAYAPGSTIRLSAYNLGTLPNPSVTITDADGNTSTVPIQATAANSLDVKLPPQTGLGGAYLTLASGTAKSFATLFVDSQDNIPALNGCTYFLSPSSVSIAAGAATIGVLVVTQPGCTYTLTPDTTGLSGSPSGTGTGILSVSAATNNGPSRTLTFEIAGQSITLTQGAPPIAITPGGIVPLYSTLTTIQPGEWVSIYGSNLASSTVTWGGNFPTFLGGTSVTIDGKAAYLLSVSPSQINLQVPDDTSTGSVPVVVTTAIGTSASTVTLGPFAPSFLLLDSKHVTGIILRSDGSGAYGGGTYDILGPTGSSLGYPTVAAKAGDAVELFGVGFGPTSPAVPAGQAFSGAAATTNPVQLAIGGTTVTPLFAGLISAGLYQINLTIPAGLGIGDLSLVATVGGAQTQSGVVVSVQ
jgi:uncharacterized protein (TIGR03437 family)